MGNLGPSGFDASGVEPSADFDPLPPGWYVAELSGSAMLPNSKGTGEYLKLEFTILDGPFASRKIWAQLNLINPSTQAVGIAQRELSSLCRAAGKLRVQDSLELHSIPLELSVRIKSDGEYGPQNVIKGYREISGHGAGPSPTPTTRNWKRPPSSGGNGTTAPVPPPAPATPAAPASTGRNRNVPWLTR